MAGELRWDELSRLDAGGWHSRAYAGEPPPSLRALARYVLRNGFALNIEIKPTPGSEHRTGAVAGEQVRALWAGSATLPLFSSFRPEALQGARDSAPEVPRALLLDTLWSGWLDVARALGVGAVVTNYTLMDLALITQLRGEGWRTLCYTVNDEAEAARLQRLGIDGLITDAVDRFSPGS
jgi:glycerophosphoryl diester phosphodiesterase